MQISHNSFLFAAVAALGLSVPASLAHTSSAASSSTSSSSSSSSSSNFSGSYIPGLEVFTTPSDISAIFSTYTGGAPILGAVLKTTVTAVSPNKYTSSGLLAGTAVWSQKGVGSYLWAEGALKASIGTTAGSGTPPLITSSATVQSAVKAGFAAGLKTKQAGLFNSCLVVDVTSSNFVGFTTPTTNFKAAVVPVASGWDAATTVPPTPQRYVRFNHEDMYNKMPSGTSTNTHMYVTPFAAPASTITSTMFAYCGWTYLHKNQQLAFGIQPTAHAAVSAYAASQLSASKVHNIVQFHVGLGGVFDPTKNYTNIPMNTNNSYNAYAIKADAAFDLNNVHQWVYGGNITSDKCMAKLSNLSNYSNFTRVNDTDCLVVSRAFFLGDLVEVGPKFDQAKDLLAVILPGQSESDMVGYGRFVASTTTVADLGTKTWLRANSVPYSIPKIGQTAERQQGLTSGGGVLAEAGAVMPTGTKSLVIAYVAKGTATDVVMQRPAPGTKTASAATFLLQGAVAFGSNVSTATGTSTTKGVITQFTPCVPYTTTAAGTNPVEYTFTPATHFAADVYYWPGMASAFSNTTSFLTPTKVSSTATATGDLLKNPACLIGSHGVGRKAGNLTFTVTVHDISAGVDASSSTGNTTISFTAARYLVLGGESKLGEQDSIYYGRDATDAEAILKIADDMHTNGGTLHREINATAGKFNASTFTFTVPVGVGASAGLRDIAGLHIACTQNNNDSQSPACVQANISVTTTFTPYNTLTGVFTAILNEIPPLINVTASEDSQVGFSPVLLTTSSSTGIFDNSGCMQDKGGITITKNDRCLLPIPAGQIVSYLNGTANSTSPTAQTIDENPFTNSSEGLALVRYIVPTINVTTGSSTNFSFSSYNVNTGKSSNNTKAVNVSVSKTNGTEQKQAYDQDTDRPLLAYDHYRTAEGSSVSAGDEAVPMVMITTDQANESITLLTLGYTLQNGSTRVLVAIAAFVSALVAMLVA